uniref:Uncharacterized protein n=1 Tax=Sphaerodactylus townsendi TaxID=933632 RepID=A0ACB8GC15_9SAUR
MVYLGERETRIPVSMCLCVHEMVAVPLHHAALMSDSFSWVMKAGRAVQGGRKLEYVPDRDVIQVSEEQSAMLPIKQNHPSWHFCVSTTSAVCHMYYISGFEMTF